MFKEAMATCNPESLDILSHCLSDHKTSHLQTSYAADHRWGSRVQGLGFRAHRNMRILSPQTHEILGTPSPNSKGPGRDCPMTPIRFLVQGMGYQKHIIKAFKGLRTLGLVSHRGTDTDEGPACSWCLNKACQNQIPFRHTQT